LCSGEKASGTFNVWGFRDSCCYIFRNDVNEGISLVRKKGV
jgi:hypothetical protein